MNLNNKIIVITGSGRSIGRVLALALAKEGANIVLTARNKEEINSVKKEIESQGGTAIAVKTDLSVEKDVVNLVKVVLEKWNKFDVLINNAGLVTDRVLNVDERELLDIPYNKWKYLFDVNLNTTFLCSKHFGKVMRDQKFGHIVNISSNLGKNVFKGFGAYSCAKAGVEHFTKILALELEDFNIKVNCLSPSYSIKIKEREFDNGLQGKNPEEMIDPVKKLCLTKISGKSFTVDTNI
jgi:3-oxoacyl-[acyl-carrier protein] reductase